MWKDNRMKINRLKLRGFIGIKKGLDVDEIELDLSGLSGLVAFSGPNGKGKTSILESLHAYRTLASRKKALPAHCFLRDSYRELEFDYQGSSYRTKVLIDCDSGRQEGYVWKNGESMVDGKARNYDSYIESLFGSKDLFFNSIFCAQNSQKLSDLTTGKLKELFAEFLQLEKYVTYENTVKQCLGALVAQVTAYSRQIEALQSQIGFGDLEGALSTAQGNLEAETIRMRGAENRLNEIATKVVSVKEKIAANAALEDRANDFRKRIEETEKALDSEKTDYESRVTGLRESLRNCNAEIAGYSAILEKRAAIETAGLRAKELQKSLAEKNKGYHEGQERLADIRAQIATAELEIRETGSPHEDEHKIPVLRERIRNLEGKTGELTKRDPACVSKTCSFIKSGMDAQNVLPGLKAELTELQARIDNHKASEAVGLARKTIVMLTLKEDEVQAAGSLAEMKELINEQNKEFQTVSKLADKVGNIQVAIARKEDAENRAVEVRAKGMAEKEAYEAKVRTLKGGLQSMENSFAEIFSKIDHSAKETLAEFELTREGLTSLKDSIADKITTFTNAIRNAQSDIEKRDTLQGQAKDLKAKSESIQKQISEWTYLRNAVSKDGLRALEIDSVAPSISAYANQILFNTFGPAYSVKLRTQDDDGRETLDILALEEDGRETFLEDLSGGERVYALKALRLAMTLIAKEKGGRALKSCFCDEEDGSLDDGNAENFIHMYRAFIEAGGFDSCFFISHREKCISMADHVLEFSSNGISVN
jgi:exonuclease SbcC